MRVLHLFPCLSFLSLFMFHIEAIEEIGEDRLVELLANESVFVLDVRTLREWRAGALERSVLVDWLEPHFAFRLGQIAEARPVIVYCRRGTRSRQALPVVEASLFTTVYHLTNGTESLSRELLK